MSEPAAGKGPWRPSHNPWAVAMTVTMATFMEVLDTSIANVALAPHRRRAFRPGRMSPPGVLTQLPGVERHRAAHLCWMSDRFGRKRFYMTCVALFTRSSLLCGLSTSLGMLIFFRIIQGAGGRRPRPSEQAILADNFLPEQRGMGFAMYGMAVVLAPAIGPLLGGWITDNYNWHWIFFINVPVGILSLYLTERLVEDPPWIADARSAPSMNRWTTPASPWLPSASVRYRWCSTRVSARTGSARTSSRYSPSSASSPWCHSSSGSGTRSIPFSTCECCASAISRSVTS